MHVLVVYCATRGFLELNMLLQDMNSVGLLVHSTQMHQINHWKMGPPFWV